MEVERSLGFSIIGPRSDTMMAGRCKARITRCKPLHAAGKPTRTGVSTLNCRFDRAARATVFKQRGPRDPRISRELSILPPPLPPSPAPTFVGAGMRRAFAFERSWLPAARAVIRYRARSIEIEIETVIFIKPASGLQVEDETARFGVFRRERIRRCPSPAANSATRRQWRNPPTSPPLRPPIERST